MMQNKIIITRSPEDSAEIAQEVTAQGFVSLIEPVLSVEILPEALPPEAEALPLVFTSANGVRAFAAKSDVRSLNVYTVGRNTADEARQVGFQNVETASGTVHDLAEYLENEAKTGLTELFYVRGRDVSEDLGVILAKKGLKTTEFVGYKADSVQNLSINVLKALDNREIKGVMLFSPRAARTFTELVEQYDRTFRMKAITALCISDAVVKSCSALPFGDVLVADKPDRYGMMRLLEKLATAE